MTTSATDDGDDEPHLTKEQQAALIRALSTPAFTNSLNQLQKQINGPLANALQQLTRPIAADVAAQAIPVLKAFQLQNKAATRVGAPQLLAQVTQQSGVRLALEPMFTQIAEQQRQWAKALAIPLMEMARAQSRLAGLVINPEFTHSLEHINDLSRLRLEFPTAAGFERLAGLVEDGEFDAATLEAAETGIVAEAQLSAAIDAAAEALFLARPRITRKRARQILVLWVWLMWAAVVTGVALVMPPPIGTFISLAGTPTGPKTVKKAGDEFDRRFPPEDKHVDG